MFTIRGGMRPWYFLMGEPVIDHFTLFFLLAGAVVALVRFRRPEHAFLLVWWFIGLASTLVSNPALDMDERRIMMSLPPTYLLATAGLLGIGDLMTQSFRGRLSDRILRSAHRARTR